MIKNNNKIYRFINLYTHTECQCHWCFTILFWNNNFKLCTKRFVQRHPVLCGCGRSLITSHTRFSWWLQAWLNDSETSEKSWTGDHDSKRRWQMLSTVSLVFFPPKQQPQKGKFQNNQTHQWNKTCEETVTAQECSAKPVKWKYNTVNNS